MRAILRIQQHNPSAAVHLKSSCSLLRRRLLTHPLRCRKATLVWLAANLQASTTLYRLCMYVQYSTGRQPLIILVKILIWNVRRSDNKLTGCISKTA
jgi:hypothetical protein